MTEKDAQQATEEVENEKVENEVNNEASHDQEDQAEVDVHNEKEDQESTVTVEELEEKIKRLEAEKEDLNNKLLRVQADYDNFRRRSREEKARDRQFRAQELVENLLPIADTFSRALQSEAESEETKAFKQGVEMVFKQFMSALEKEGVEAIEPLHQPFDPNDHQAVMQDEESDHEPNTVTEVLQKGFKLNGRVLRPAMVKVRA
ncbi:protein GrpE [Pullulanibacillus camelliae]|uniref:Protein GrpE n=1 Tax=Pullulanibacillus camelliae TaxID=1707096 RepID=A0A8J2YJ74_9BACL|nr:nucleotide exchange factor GrpE [Pullulanibacillus camelliae]GGE47276.1 protein GrpE [Pullulanibacillus camelliae]